MSDYIHETDGTEDDDGIYGEEEENYGRCPVCGSAGDMLNHGKNHWMVCHDHKVKWRIGSGFFSIFQRDRPAKWDQAGAILAEYREVKPLLDEDDAPPQDSEIDRFRRLLDS
jgi:hypothetical protein